MDHKSKKGSFAKFLDKEQAIFDAENYKDINFFKKSKNILIFFYLAISVLSYVISDQLQVEDILVGISVYLVLIPFIYFNHRWAIVISCSMYLLDKIIFISQQIGSPISHIIFGLLVLTISYSSFITATHLKEIDKRD